MKSPLPFSLPLPLLPIVLTTALAAAFLTTSCERRGGVHLTAVAEDARVVGLRRDFLADSSRWRAPRAEEIAALAKLDRDLKAKWRGLAIPDSKDAAAIALSRAITDVRQKLDRACADRSFLTARAKPVWDEREASGWAGGATPENDTGYRDPYAFYNALPAETKAELNRAAPPGSQPRRGCRRTHHPAAPLSRGIVVTFIHTSSPRPPSESLTNPGPLPAVALPP